MNTTSQFNADLTFHPIINNSPRRFTREQVEEYNHQGFTTGITLLEAEELEVMQRFFARSKAAVTASSDGGFQSFHHKIPELYDIVTQPLLVEHLQDLLGPNVVCFVSQYVCKEPGDEREVVWHQDAAYNPLDAKSVIVWLAVHDASIENGCMWFSPGSHLSGLMDFSSPENQANVIGSKTVANAEQIGEKIPIELKAGQAVFFSDLLLHWSPGNRSQTQPRGGFTMTFAGAETAIDEIAPQFNVSNRESVICSGEDVNLNWAHHPRPEPVE